MAVTTETRLTAFSSSEDVEMIQKSQKQYTMQTFTKITDSYKQSASFKNKPRIIKLDMYELENEKEIATNSTQKFRKNDALSYLEILFEDFNGKHWSTLKDSLQKRHYLKTEGVRP